MKQLHMRALPLMLGVLGVIAAKETHASDPLDSASVQTLIETRQQGFKKMGAAAKALRDELKSSAPNDALLVQASHAIEAAAEAQTRWFPEGSGPESGVDTDALPYIWKNREKFDSIAAQLRAETKKLVAATSAHDLPALRTQFKVVGEVCSSCHRSFRAD